MYRFLFFLAVCAMYVLTSFTGVKAQAVHCDPLPNLPPGSYQLSCYSCTVHDNILTARCLTIKGWPNETSVRVDTCPDHYFCNNDGTLQCSHC